MGPARGLPLYIGRYYIGYGQGARAGFRVATIPAKAGIHPWGGGGAPRVWAMRCRGGSRTAPTEAAVVPAQGVVTARAATIVWQPFLRSLSSWKRGAGIHPWGGGGAPRVWAMRCRGGSRTAPTEAAVVPSQMVRQAHHERAWNLPFVPVSSTGQALSVSKDASGKSPKFPLQTAQNRLANR